MVVGLAADAAADPHLAHHLEHGLVGDAREDLRDRSAATASAFVAPPSATAEAAATLCSYVYLACLPSMVSSTSLPNARYIRRRCLTVPLGMERAREAAQRPMPESNSSAACLLVSTSCFTLRSVRIRTPPFLVSKKWGAVQAQADGRAVLRRCTYCRGTETPIANSDRFVIQPCSR